MKGILIVLLVLLLGNVILLYLLAPRLSGRRKGTSVFWSEMGSSGLHDIKRNPGKFDPGVSGGDRSRLWD